MAVALGLGFCAAAAQGQPTRIVAESALLKVSEEVTVPARASGVLAALSIEEGARVERGALIATIDTAETELLLRRAKIEYELAARRAASDVAIRSAETLVEYSRSEHARMRRAAEELPGSVSRSEVEESRVNAEQAALDLEQARQDHELDVLSAELKETEHEIAKQKFETHRVVAPIDGVLVETLREAGEWVEPGDEVARLTRVDRLRVEGLAPIDAVARGLLGARMRVSAILDEGEAVRAEGRVTFVNPEVNPVSGLVLVRGEFDNPELRLMPGMRVEFEILAPSPEPVSPE